MSGSPSVISIAKCNDGDDLSSLFLLRFNHHYQIKLNAKFFIALSLLY